MQSKRGRKPTLPAAHQMIQDFTNYLVNIKGYSTETAKAYKADVQRFARWAKRELTDARWSTMNRGIIDHYITTCAEEGKAPTTTNRYLASISAMYKYMKRQGYEVTDPTRTESRRKVPTTIPNTIEEDELIKALDNSTGAAKLMLGILMSTGIRIQEMLNLEDKDINYGTGAMIIRNGKGNKSRKVYCSRRALVPLNEMHYNGQLQGKIFKSFSQRDARWMIYNALRPYCHARQLSPHAIRHTVATAMARKGVNTVTLSKILGHRELKTTQKYIDFAQCDVERAMRSAAIA